MDSNQDAQKIDSLTIHIQKQLTAGFQPNEISQQLIAAGWNEDLVKQAFTKVQAGIMPDKVSASGGPTGHQITSSAPQRGRIKTGWLLFKESWKVLRSDKMLTRYIIMSAIIGIFWTIIYVIALIVGRNVFLTKGTTNSGTNNGGLTPLGIIPTLIYYIFAYFIVNLYAAGLAANVLDLFHGNKGAYNDYMKKARSKALPLFVFSVIEATIGLILRAIAERSKLLGRIIVWVVGAAWSLARLFVVPIIVSSDEGAVEAIKDSTKLLVATWGENLVSRVSMGGVLFLFFILIMIPISFLILVIGGFIGGGVGIIVGAVLILIAILAYSIVSSAAGSVLNTALFYYAKNHQVPGAFDANLLTSVFVKRKRGILGNKIDQ